jgi:hypothetical protein
MRKQMEGDNNQRRETARQARRAGKLASEVSGTTGASKQLKEAKPGATHQERIDLKSEGKPRVMGRNVPEARPGSRDPETLDQEKHPRL